MAISKYKIKHSTHASDLCFLASFVGNPMTKIMGICDGRRIIKATSVIMFQILNQTVPLLAKLPTIAGFVNTCNPC